MEPARFFLFISLFSFFRWDYDCNSVDVLVLIRSPAKRWIFLGKNRLFLCRTDSTPPSPLPPPLTIAPLESVVVNRRQFQKTSLLINHPHSNKRPFSNKHPCSVSVIALPECLYTEMHRGSSSFIAHLKPHDRKSGLRLSFAIFMSPWVHSSFKRLLG